MIKNAAAIQGACDRCLRCCDDARVVALHAFMSRSSSIDSLPSSP
jgi:hypothetical protein